MNQMVTKSIQYSNVWNASLYWSTTQNLPGIDMQKWEYIEDIE